MRWSWQQPPVFGRRAHRLTGPYRRERTVGIEPAPGEQLVRRDPVPTATSDTNIP